MSGQNRYSDEFKIDAVAQVTERGYSVTEVAERLGISTKSLYTWMAQFSKPQRTGAWYDPDCGTDDKPICKHGNPNVLTVDRGTSTLAQGPVAHSCLVEVSKFIGDLPHVTAHLPPAIEEQTQA